MAANAFVAPNAPLNCTECEPASTVNALAVDVLLLIVPPKVISALPASIVTSAFKTTEPLNVIGAPPAVKFEFTLIAVAAEIEIPPVFVESPIAASTVTVSTPVEVKPPLRAPIEVPDDVLIVTD